MKQPIFKLTNIIDSSYWAGNHEFPIVAIEWGVPGRITRIEVDIDSEIVSFFDDDFDGFFKNEYGNIKGVIKK
jgi:hypothetical protein